MFRRLPPQSCSPRERDQPYPPVRGMGSEIEEHWRLLYCIKPSDHVRGLLRCSCLPGSCCQASDGATHTDELRFAYDFLLPVGTPVLAPHHAL